MKPSELLTLALDHLSMHDVLEGYKESCICGAVMQAEKKVNSDASSKAHVLVCTRIRHRLGKWGYASSWLRHNYPSARSATFEEIQQWRRAWMLDMIEEWKREGK